MTGTPPPGRSAADKAGPVLAAIATIFLLGLVLGFILGRTL